MGMTLDKCPQLRHALKRVTAEGCLLTVFPAAVAANLSRREDWMVQHSPPQMYSPAGRHTQVHRKLEYIAMEIR